ncbi:MAG TPA: mechanosensitive ion channel domain-containing protein [Rhodothermales bacterium]|nr:mechanosensitive ion channel domain-containing protein [Rhodothermales bacterium]
MEELLTTADQYGEVLLDWLNRPAILVEAVIIVALFALARLLTWWAEPKARAKARRIRKMPGLLRLVVILLRRLVWIFYVALLTTAYALIQSLGPMDGQLLGTALLLALAWLVISIVSQVIRSRTVGRTFAFIGWAYVAATILGITTEIEVALDRIGFGIGAEYRITLLDLLRAFLLIGIALWLAFIIGNFLDRRLRASRELTPNLRMLVGKVLRVTLLALASLIALSALGVDLTLLTVLSGAIGVGIGFGLQKLMSNLFSGIVILLDRSIKPGDTISLGETFGWIRELRARFVSVVTRDGREYLIPNEDFVTHQVINWSYSDDLVRLDVPIRSSYDADPQQVAAIAIEAAASVPRVVRVQMPVCWLTAFGDYSLEYLLRFWIRDPQNGLTNVRGQVLQAVWDAFRDNDIRVPYPHQEVIMKTPVTISNPT